jgi:hypothetical protein
MNLQYRIARMCLHLKCSSNLQVFHEFVVLCGPLTTSLSPERYQISNFNYAANLNSAAFDPRPSALLSSLPPSTDQFSPRLDSYRRLVFATELVEEIWPPCGARM